MIEPCIEDDKSWVSKMTDEELIKILEDHNIAYGTVADMSNNSTLINNGVVVLKSGDECRVEFMTEREIIERTIDFFTNRLVSPEEFTVRSGALSEFVMKDVALKALGYMYNAIKKDHDDVRISINIGTRTSPNIIDWKFIARNADGVEIADYTIMPNKRDIDIEFDVVRMIGVDQYGRVFQLEYSEE